MFRFSKPFIIRQVASVLALIEGILILQFRLKIVHHLTGVSTQIHFFTLPQKNILLLPVWHRQTGNDDQNNLLFIFKHLNTRHRLDIDT